MDEFQPVAAVLDPLGGTVERVVSYRELPAPPVTFASWYEGLRVLGTDAGIWVQPFPGGPIGLLTGTGLAHVSHGAGTRLQVVTESGAWCAPLPRGQDIADTAKTRPKLPLNPTELLHIRPDGTVARPVVDRPVRTLRAGADGVYALLDVEPWTRHHLGADHWDLVYEQKWIRLAPPETARPMYRADDLPATAEPAMPARRTAGLLGAGSPWHAPPHEGNRGLPAGGLRWAFGWDRDGQRHRGKRQAVATGHDPGDNTEYHRVSLGAGMVDAAAVAEPYLWVAIRRRAGSPPYSGGPVELSRIDTRDGSTETLVPADSVDITAHCWPLPEKPADADSYAEYQRGQFDGLDAYWRPQSGGPLRPLAEGLGDCRSELVGTWPDTAVRISFTLERLPGVRLIRTIPIFDELGRQFPPEHAEIHLMEDLDTRAVPPVTDAVDGLLEM